jgi:phosphatidylserine decarboxylase
MRIHKAGYSVIAVLMLILIAINSLIFYKAHNPGVLSISLIVSGLLALFVLRFFRYPNRKIEFTENEIIAPADGTVVTIEEIEQHDFVDGRRIQISIFMSVWNVHINWVPAIGEIKQVLHFDGKFMVAKAPKASHLNERSVVVIQPKNSQTILVKQIAGAVARRIITYVKPGTLAIAGDQLGFIRFGSRVDVLLPLDYTVKIKLQQKVTGGKTIIAERE